MEEVPGWPFLGRSFVPVGGNVEMLSVVPGVVVTRSNATLSLTDDSLQPRRWWSSLPVSVECVSTKADNVGTSIFGNDYLIEEVTLTKISISQLVGALGNPINAIGRPASLKAPAILHRRSVNQP